MRRKKQTNREQFGRYAFAEMKIKWFIVDIVNNTLQHSAIQYKLIDSLPGIHNLDWNDPVSLLQVCRAIVPLVKQHNKCNDSFNTSTVSVPWLLIPLFFQTGE